jgi:hypothetical protein
MRFCVGIKVILNIWAPDHFGMEFGGDPCYTASVRGSEIAYGHDGFVLNKLGFEFNV